MVTALSLFLSCFPPLMAEARAADVKPRYRVVLARPIDADPITTEALTRVSGELEAAGFEIRAVPINRDADPRSTVESMGRELDPVAAFAIFPGPSSPVGVSTAEIWVSDRLTGRATVQRLVVDPRASNRGAAVLAVHAVELLKASLAELWVDSNTGRRGERAAAAARAEPDATEASVHAGRAYVLTGFAVEAGGGVLAHPAGFAAEWTPMLRLSFGMPNGFAVRLGAMVAGEMLQISNDRGTARLRQQMLTVEGLASFRAWRRVQPVASVGGGVYRLGVTGTSNMPGAFVDGSDRSWALVVAAGGGVVVGLGDHVALTVDLRALGFVPRPVVRLGDVEAGQAGRPALLTTAGLIGIF